MFTDHEVILGTLTFVKSPRKLLDVTVSPISVDFMQMLMYSCSAGMFAIFTVSFLCLVLISNC